MSKLMSDVAKTFTDPLIYNLMVMDICLQLIKYILTGYDTYDKVVAIIFVVCLFFVTLIIEEK